MAEDQTVTDSGGQYSFTGLRAGTYSVEISSFDTNEVSFSSTSGAATVGVGESKVVSFDGTYLRTAGIQGQVSVDGEGLQGVTVTLVGEGEDRSETTNASGQYAFSQLKGGTYQVAISGYDADDYEFEVTSKSATVATGETANVPFEGTLLRTAGIAGRVSLDDGMGLDGVTVTLAGAAEATTATANGGQYSFAGLAAGTYVLSITNPNPTAYNFAEDEMQKTVMLADDQAAIVNFSGTHTRTASVSGVLFIDEVMQDKMHNDGEPSIAAAIAPLVAAGVLDQATVAGLLAKAKVRLRGPDLNTMQYVDIGLDGSFTTGANLMAGSYQVELPVNDDEVAAGLAAVGVAFVGGSMVVEVEAGGAATVNFPFRITTQTLVAGARMGAGDHLGVPVAGVKLALYARADGTGMLGEGTTNEMGMATFSFARADNTGPAGNDNIVFVKAMSTGHDALVVSGNEFTEVSYAGTDRVSHASAAATMVNTAVAFDFWVKSAEMARDGDMGLKGWKTTVMMGDAALDMGPKATDKDGKSSFAYTVTPAMLPATFKVMATEGDKAGQPDQGEAWEQSDALMHTHTGLDLPGGDTPDLGPIRVEFTTQAVYVGVHRELDDRTGYTDYHGVGDGDDRPGGNAVDKIEIKLMVANPQGRGLVPYEYDADADPDTDDTEATAKVGSSGIVSFKNIPAETEITVVVETPSNIMIVPDSYASKQIDAFGDQLDDYPDGNMVGAFGDGSGARPDVWICPLWRLDHEDANDNCSTYAYKWATGTVSGKVSKLRKGDKATLTLDPVNSNDDYADDLAMEKVVTGTGSDVDYSFTGVADGQYTVTLEAKAGSWEKDDAKGVEIEHNEKNSATDYSGETDGGNNLSATDLRGIIKGRIANESNGRTGLTRDESRAGVEVTLHAASAAIRSGANRGRRTIGAKLATAETDGDGVFMFENLEVGKNYFLQTVETDLYTAVRTGETRTPGQKAADVVKYALATAIVPPTPSVKPGTPTWNHRTNTATANGANNFVLLYKDGEVDGEVSDPSARAAHSRAVVELLQCQTATVTEGENPVINACTAYTGVEEEAAVDADGNWSADGLREGVYRVIVDLPAGYIHVDSAGGTETTNSSFYNQQFVELKGGRAEDDTRTFHIKDENAGSASALDSLRVGNVLCSTNGFTAANPASNACGAASNKASGSFSVTAFASTGAVVRLSNLGTDDDVNAGSNRSFQVNNKRASTVKLSEPGSESFFVHVRSQDGYSTNGSAGLDNASSVGFHLRRDSDARLDKLLITFAGGRIELDRRELGLDPNDPDGETGPVTGAHPVSVTIDKADDGTSAVPTALTLSATGKNTSYDLFTYATLDNTTAQCGAAADITGTSPHSITLPANAGSTKGSVGFCVLITDSNGAAENTDANTANNNIYRVILTRK